jgi:hypothetical protein
MTFYEIITAIFATLIVPLVTLYVQHELTKERERKKRFDDAVCDFRKVFNKAIADITAPNYVGFKREMFPTYHAAYRDFRPYVRRKYQKKYDEAWNKYEIHVVHPESLFGREPKDLVKDIKELLKFADLGL